jgi:hypothetical protein
MNEGGDRQLTSHHPSSDHDHSDIQEFHHDSSSNELFVDRKSSTATNDVGSNGKMQEHFGFRYYF